MKNIMIKDTERQKMKIPQVLTTKFSIPQIKN